MFICLFLYISSAFFSVLFNQSPFLPLSLLFSLPTTRKPNRHSCLNSVDSSVWCGVGSDDGDEVIKYFDEEGNPFVVACCRGDYCRNAQHLTNHTLLSVAGLFLRSFPSLHYILPRFPALHSLLFFEFRSHFGRFLIII